MSITIIEDSRTISHIIGNTLKAYGFVARIFTSEDVSKEGIPLGEVFIINSNLSKIESTAVITDVKNRSSHPGVICINNIGNWKDNVKMIETGADEAMSYPFPMQELIARLRSLINRPRENVIKKYKAGPLSVNTYSQQILLQDEPLELRRKEFSLLSYLIRNKERPVSRSELLDNVWDYRRINNSNTVDVHINRLRNKIGDRDVIKTVHGFGYQIKEKRRKPSKIQNID